MEAPFIHPLLEGEVPPCYYSCCCCCCCSYVCHAQGTPPLDSEMGWTKEVWPKTNLINWKTKRVAFFFSAKKYFKICHSLKKKKSRFFVSGLGLTGELRLNCIFLILRNKEYLIFVVEQNIVQKFQYFWRRKKNDFLTILTFFWIFGFLLIFDFFGVFF